MEFSLKNFQSINPVYSLYALHLLERYQRFQPNGAERNVECVFLLNMKCFVILKYQQKNTLITKGK